MTAFVVYEPRSAGGRTGRHWREVQGALEAIFPLMEVMPSGGPGQAARLVRDALRNGHLDIVAVGGDGLINEAVNGLFDRGTLVSPDAVFSFVPTGGELSRHFGIEPGAGAAILRLRQSRIRKLDVGRVLCLTPQGEPTMRYFLGTARFGLAGRIARARAHGLAPALSRLAALLSWRGCHVRLMAPAGTDHPGFDEIAGISNVTAATGPGTGLFTLSVMAGASRMALLRGRPVAARKSRTARLTAAPTVDTRAPVDVETDGESAGVLPATFEILPHAINVRL